ncbi:MAG TPA: hypothetical protein VFT52_04410 [Luteimonas sp.]|jgi:antitoxin component of MazEF toxin-antitoxin module|nr:hypothetical protein [Alphaproteobacteria bacterium]HEU4991718.1 hypothetical protein [Luteimonas sp.]
MSTAVLRQSGGSVILAIPKAIAESMGVTARSQVSLALHGRTLTVTPGYSIEALVAGCSERNDHEIALDGEVGGERIE